MDLPTYTNIWRIEKRLYKLYDLRLPMPLPLGQIVAFAGITVPYLLFLTLIGIPFNHNLFWLYVLPPGVLTWLVTRPVLENKRLPELLVSQVRYLGEPSRWSRMAPDSEKDDITITGRVWHAAVAPAREAAASPVTGRAPDQITAGSGQMPWLEQAAPPTRQRGEPRHRRPAPGPQRPPGHGPIEHGPRKLVTPPEWAQRPEPVVHQPEPAQPEPAGQQRPAERIPPPEWAQRVPAAPGGRPERFTPPEWAQRAGRPGSAGQPGAPPRREQTAPPERAAAARQGPVAIPGHPPLPPASSARATGGQTPVRERARGVDPAPPARQQVTAHADPPGTGATPPPHPPARRPSPPAGGPPGAGTAPWPGRPAHGPAGAPRLRPIEVAHIDKDTRQGAALVLPPPLKERPHAGQEAVPAAPQAGTQAGPATPAAGPAEPLVQGPGRAAPAAGKPVEPPVRPVAGPSQASQPVSAAAPGTGPAKAQEASGEPVPAEASKPQGLVSVAPVASLPVSGPQAPSAGGGVAGGGAKAPAGQIGPAGQAPVAVTVAYGPGGTPPPRTVERALSGPAAQRMRGWNDRVALVPGGGGPGRPGAVDQEERDKARARMVLPGPYRIVVLGCTRGAGQTVIALLTARLLANLRGEPVGALDLNPGTGSLARRAGIKPAGFVRDLLAGTIKDTDSETESPAGSRLDVIGGDAGLASGQGLDEPAYAKIGERLATRYGISLVDPGASAVARALDIADQLVLVAPASGEAPQAVSMTQEWLQAHDHRGLAQRAVLVVNGVSGRSLADVERAEAIASGRFRAIVRIPWEDQIDASRGPCAGTPPRPATRQALTALAGVLVSGLVAAGSPGAGSPSAGSPGAGSPGRGVR